ncbi:MAG TPA: PD-(D/E)XK nuclease-like domain-containing protein [Polyangiaceae bacterium]
MAEAARVIDPFADYADLPGVNWSTLKHILRSPLHYQHALKAPPKETAAMRFGTAVHVAALEPQQFRLRYLVEPDFGPLQSSKNRQKRDEWRSENEGALFLDQDDYDRIQAVASAVRAHPAARRLIEDIEVELPIQWTDRATGVLCKGRVDGVGRTYIIDLKTTTNAEPWAFASSAAKLLYHAQQAFYVEGYRAAHNEVRGAVLIAAESVAPFDVVVYELEDEPLGVGRELYEQALVRLVECERTGSWPGISPDILPFKLPKWASPNDDDDLSDLGLI